MKHGDRGVGSYGIALLVCGVASLTACGRDRGPSTSTTPPAAQAGGGPVPATAAPAPIAQSAEPAPAATAAPTATAAATAGPADPAAPVDPTAQVVAAVNGQDGEVEGGLLGSEEAAPAEPRLLGRDR